MKIFFKITIVALFFSSLIVFDGCAFSSKKTAPATKQQIMEAYLSKVNKTDGINKNEAVLLAQSQVIFLGYEHDYNLHNPESVKENHSSWIIKFLPVSKTIKELIHKPTIVITVSKKDGQVDWQEEYREN